MAQLFQNEKDAFALGWLPDALQTVRNEAIYTAVLTHVKTVKNQLEASKDTFYIGYRALNYCLSALGFQRYNVSETLELLKFFAESKDSRVSWNGIVASGALTGIGHLR
jgi:hypothetical protein